MVSIGKENNLTFNNAFIVVRYILYVLCHRCSSTCIYMSLFLHMYYILLREVFPFLHRHIYQGIFVFTLIIRMSLIVPNCLSNEAINTVLILPRW